MLPENFEPCDDDDDDVDDGWGSWGVMSWPSGGRDQHHFISSFFGHDTHLHEQQSANLTPAAAHEALCAKSANKHI